MAPVGVEVGRRYGFWIFGFLDLGVRMSCEPVRRLDDTQDME
jgi:hypothetical protein